MASSKRNQNRSTTIWIIIIALVAILMFVLFYNVWKEEDAYKEHLENEQNHPK